MDSCGNTKAKETNMSKEQVKASQADAAVNRPNARSGLVVRKITITKPEVSWPD